MTDELRERLRARYTVSDEFSTCTPLANPDGPEAADYIEALEAENVRLNGAVRTVQAAAKTIMHAEGEELKTLREEHREWHLAIGSLDSEREANAILTDELTTLRAQLAQAVEALGQCASVPFSGWTIAREFARATLASIAPKEADHG